MNCGLLCAKARLGSRQRARAAWQAARVSEIIFGMVAPLSMAESLDGTPAERKWATAVRSDGSTGGLRLSFARGASHVVIAGTRSRDQLRRAPWTVERRAGRSRGVRRKADRERTAGSGPAVVPGSARHSARQDGDGR